MKEELIRVGDLQFKPFLPANVIQDRIKALGKALTIRYGDKKPVFLGVLNGAFMFAADLVRACPFECELSFIKLSSYRGMRSSGEVQQLIGLDRSIAGRHVILVEDIIDSGLTMFRFLPELRKLEPASVSIVSLLVKPDQVLHKIPVDYVGFEIPSVFVLGYGMDYEGLGRNLPDLYQVVKP